MRLNVRQPGVGVPGELGGDVVGGAVGRVPREVAEGPLVEAFHRRPEPRSASARESPKPTHTERPCCQGTPVRPSSRGEVLDLGSRVVPSLRRDEHAEPTVAEAGCTLERGPAATPHHDRHGRRRSRRHPCAVHREHLPVVVDSLARKKRAHDGEAVVHPPAARPDVHAADLELVRIVAAQSDPEHQPTRCELRQRAELARRR